MDFGVPFGSSSCLLHHHEVRRKEVLFDVREQSAVLFFEILLAKGLVQVFKVVVGKELGLVHARGVHDTEDDLARVDN